VLAADYRWESRAPHAAEAAFRHGRVLADLGRTGEALGAFLHGAELAEDPALRARCRFEIAQSLRQSLQLPEAEEAYWDLILDPTTPREFIASAWQWLGELQEQQGRLVDARVSWRAWRASARTFAEEIRAVDALACLELDQRNGPALDFLLTMLLEECEPLLRQGNQAGRELFRRLDRMKVRARLRELLWSAAWHGDDHGHRQLIRVAQRHAQLLDPCSLQELASPAADVQGGRGLPVGDHLEVVEADAVGPAGAHHLHRGFLRGHARGQVDVGVSPPRAFLLFGRREHPVSEGLAAALETLAQALNLDEVDADPRNPSRRSESHRGGG
jgi:tetratricopeptide (TPR) repeat protein